jgi:hypothetical protein
LPGTNDLLLLERFYRKPLVQARLSRARLAAEIVPEPLAVLHPPMSIDNFEGVAAFATEGEVRVLMLSDDNFSDAQRTLLLAFSLRP